MPTYELAIQRFEPGQGWEDCACYPSTDRKQARADIAEYRASEPAPYRLIRRREVA